MSTTDMRELEVSWWSGSQAPAVELAPVHLFENVEGTAGGIMLGGAGLLQDSAAPVASGLQEGRFRLRAANPADSSPDFENVDFVMAVRNDVEPAVRDEVRRWLDEEHSPSQLRVPGVQWYLGYEAVGEPHSFLNLWGLTDPAVATSEAWMTARNTDWRARLEPSVTTLDRGMFRPVRHA